MTGNIESSVPLMLDVDIDDDDDDDDNDQKNPVSKYYYSTICMHFFLLFLPRLSD